MSGLSIYTGKTYQEVREQYDVVTLMGMLITSDPTDRTTDIGKRIFEHLEDDFPSASAFAQVSRGVYERARRSWFTSKVERIILQYIRRGASLKSYCTSTAALGDMAILGLKTAGALLTFACAKAAKSHYDQIPPDAPMKKVKYCDEYGECQEGTVIDHPEAACEAAVVGDR